jgi:hypothetical protein
MAISANTLGQTANTLMSQLSANTITFDNYRNSMNSVIQSANNNPEFKNEDNAVAIYTVNIATRLSEGEATRTRRK